MKNAVYGKAMENLRNEIDAKLVNNKMCHTKLDNDLVVVRLNIVTLTLNKPAYTGICILELSKVYMYKFHYDYFKKQIW